MNTKDLIKSWNNSGRPCNVQKLMDFLGNSGYNKDDVIAALGKIGLNIHDAGPTDEQQNTEPDAEIDNNQSKTPAQTENNSTAEIEKGTEVTYNNVSYTFNGYRWTQNGKLIKNALNDELTKLYLNHVNSSNQEESSSSTEQEPASPSSTPKTKNSKFNAVAKPLAQYKEVVSKLDPTDRLFAAKMAILAYPNKNKLLSALQSKTK